MGVSVSFVPPGTPEEARKVAEIAKASKFATVACTAVLVYDWLVCLDHEYRLVFGPHLVFDLVVFALTTIKTFALSRQLGGRAASVDIFLQDGMMCYATISTMDLTAAIIFQLPRAGAGPAIAVFASIGAPVIVSISPRTYALFRCRRGAPRYPR
ncbi:hypothetical protein JCM10212_000429 [Sporobolomyces blumeae]